MTFACTFTEVAPRRPATTIGASHQSSTDAGSMVSQFLTRRESGTTSLDETTLWILDLALLVACKAVPELLKIHVEAALDEGLLRSEIIDAVAEAALYAGLPAAEQALTTVRTVFTALDLAGPVVV